jgi:hypothetical protein
MDAKLSWPSLLRPKPDLRKHPFLLEALPGGRAEVLAAELLMLANIGAMVTLGRIVISSGAVTPPPPSVEDHGARALSEPRSSSGDAPGARGSPEQPAGPDREPPAHRGAAAAERGSQSRCRPQHAVFTPERLTAIDEVLDRAEG